MKKTLFILITLITVCYYNATAQITVNKNEIKSFTSGVHAITTTHSSPSYAPSDEVIAKAYGIRTYDEERGSVQEFVSFDINNPGTITTEKDLSEYYMRAAAEANGYYYMINSRDGMCAYDLLEMDLETLTIDTVASYTVDDYESAIIFLDMTYDYNTGTMYGIGYDLETALGSDNEDEIEVELALVKIDLSTGRMTAVGHQGYCGLLTIAADNEGYLWGLDSEGELWDINKSNGKPGEPMGYASDRPASLQSMCFDPKTNILYWSGFSVSGEIGNGFLSSFNFTEENVVYNKIGNLAGNAEIIGLYIDPDPTPANTPNAVSQFTVTPAAEGVSQATLSWSNPTTLVNGESINENITVTIYRDDQLLATLSNRIAGSDETYTDNTVTIGHHDYMVVCACSNGEGKPAYVKGVYVGRDVPGAVQNLYATKTRNANEIKLSWEKPHSGKNGGWYDNAGITYRVVRYPDNKVLAEQTTATSLSDTDFTSLQGYSYTVTGFTSDGEGVACTSNTVVAGPSLNVPYECNFKKDQDVRMWTVIDGDKDGHEWFQASYSSTGQTFMKFAPDSKYNPATPANDWLITPPIKLKAGTVYTMEYDMLLLGPLFPVNYDITIGKEATIDAQSTIIKSIDSLIINMAFEPQKVVFEVKEDGEYYLGYHICNAVMVQITDVVVRELDAIDLSIANISHPNIGNINNTMSFLVTVDNLGADAVEGYVLKLMDENGNILSETSGNAPLLESQEARQHILDWTPQEIGSARLHITVEKEGDAIPDNNISDEIEIEILEEGDWAHIILHNAIMSYTPIQPSYKYSTTVTLYNADEIAYNESGYIKGIMYYTTVFNNLEVQNFNAKIWLANTDKTEVNGTDNDVTYTQVFSGTIRPTSTSTFIYIPFDTPYEYTGGNLIVKAEHTSKGEDYNLMFIGSRDDSGLWRMWYYAGDEIPFDASQVQFDTEIANISFFLTDNNAVEGIENDNTVRTYISYGNLIVAGDYDMVNIYSIDGKLCGSYTTPQPFIPMTGYAKGAYIVEVYNNGMRSTSKVMLR